MAVYMIKGNGMDIAELRKVAQEYARRQRFIETVDPHAMLELIAHIETLERRYQWAANELLACDYGDNQAEGEQIGWIIYGWRNKDIGSMRHAEKPRIYGASIDAAIDAQTGIKSSSWKAK